MSYYLNGKLWYYKGRPQWSKISSNKHSINNVSSKIEVLIKAIVPNVYMILKKFVIQIVLYFHSTHTNRNVYKAETIFCVHAQSILCTELKVKLF